eukprot:6224_1
MTQLSRKLFFVTSIVICVMTYITIGIWFNYDMSIVNLTNIIGHSIFTTQSILDELHSCKKCPSNINKVSMINPLFLHPNEPFLQQHSANPICKYLFPAYSFHSVTHKNGVFMFSQFITSMRRYCNIINVNATTMKSYKYHAGFMQTLGMIWGNIFQLFYFIDSSKQLHKETNLIIKFCSSFKYANHWMCSGVRINITNHAKQDQIHGLHPLQSLTGVFTIARTN